MNRLQLTDIDQRRSSMIDAADPWIALQCEQVAEKARFDWELWEQTHTR